jgi:hypothetical protein
MTVAAFRPREQPARAHRPAVALLDVDRELGAALPPERFAVARAQLLVRVTALRRGEWAGEELASVSSDHVGLLVVEGVIAREVLLEDTVSTELLGPGDLIRPWGPEEEPHLLGEQVRWQVLADARVAILGPAFGAALARFPEVNAVLIERLCARAKRLGTTQAICHLNNVDRRLHALFWHLAERWGRVTTEGVVIPLTLSHRLLGELVGARRPTVTTALASLEREGKVRRRANATWLVTGEPSRGPARGTGRFVSHRRRLLGAEPEAGDAVGAG